MANVFKSSLNFAINRISLQQMRYIPRWSHRKPIRVYSAEEYEEIEKKNEVVEKPQIQEPSNTKSLFTDKKIKWKYDKEQVESVDFKIKPKRKQSKPLSANKQLPKPKTTDMLETVIDADGNFIYTKMANNDQRIGVILTQVKSKNEKVKKDLILLEGKRLIQDALQSGCVLKYLIFSRKDDVEYLKPYLPTIGAKLYKMPYREMQMWSDLTTTPGVMGIFKTPNTTQYILPESLPITVICDNIREPGNLGTILRVCAGVGAEKVILTKGCVNLWETKVLRSAMGAHFKLQIHTQQEWDSIKDALDSDSSFYVADNRIVSNSIESDIPNMESLISHLPLLPYYGIDYKNSTKKIVLVIGGETCGISKESYKIAASFNGARVNIPLSSNIESLNVGTALGVIAFEIKKQLSSVK